jgi:hypothetical protein
MEKRPSHSQSQLVLRLHVYVIGADRTCIEKPLAVATLPFGVELEYFEQAEDTCPCFGLALVFDMYEFHSM